MVPKERFPPDPFPRKAEIIGGDRNEQTVWVRFVPFLGNNDSSKKRLLILNPETLPVGAAISRPQRNARENAGKVRPCNDFRAGGW